MKYLTFFLFVLSFLFYSLQLFAQTATDLNCTSCVQTAEIQNSAVTSVKIQNSAVTTVKISDGTITNTDISSSAAIDPSKISGTAWTSTNDGSGTSLEADLLDGLDASQFLRSDGSGTVNGDLMVTGNVGIGTTSPSHKLEINGSALLNNTLYLLDTYHSIRAAEGEGVYIDTYGVTDPFFIQQSTGNVGIGTTNPGNYKLAVEGTIGARELIVTEGSWSDFVFKDNYQLKSLSEVESFIQKNKHLPDIPSEKEVLENGVSVGEMQKRLLQKVEELTLYVIAQDKKIAEQDKKIAELKGKIK